MATKDVTILRNFSHVAYGSFVRGEHRRLDVDIADIFIDANLASGCEHEHEGDQVEPTQENLETVNEIIEVPDNQENMPDAIIEKPKAKRGRKKVTKDE